MATKMLGSRKPPELVRLPRELRDQIYEYALYSPPGLYYYQTDAGVPEFAAEPSRDRPVNALKHTSRQLRRETLGLEHKLNNHLVTFLGSTTLADGTVIRQCPAEQFLHFVSLQCGETARQTRLPRNIRLHYNLAPEEGPPAGRLLEAEDPYPVTSLHAVARFCETRPDVTVWWYTRVLEDIHYGRHEMTGESILEAGVELGTILRSDFPWRELTAGLMLLPVHYIHRACHEAWHPPGCLVQHDDNMCRYDIRLKTQNFRLLPEVVEGRREWEEECWDEWRDWHSSEVIAKRIEVIRGFIENGI